MKLRHLILLGLTLILSLTLVASASETLSSSKGIVALPRDKLVEEGLWDNLPYDQRLAAFQIPEWFLSNASTSELLENVLVSPTMSRLHVFDDPRFGYSSLFRDFNGFRELVSRTDFPSVLLAYYLSIPVVEDINSEENNHHYIMLWHVESLLCQSEILTRFSDRDIQLITDHAESNRAIKQLVASLYTSDYYEESLQRIAIIQLQQEAARREAEGVRIEDIVLDIQAIVDPLILRILGPLQWGYTPGNNAYQFYNNSGYGYLDFDATEKARIHNQMIADYGSGIQKVYDASRMYNCHSYVWYARSSANTRWINDASPFLSDGTHYAYGGLTSFITKFVYTGGIHSAWYSHTSGGKIYLNSKWGQAGVYVHEATVGPYGSSYSYYNPY